MKPQFCLTKSIATLIAGSLVMAANVHALPKGETVRSGNASFDRNGGRLNIRASDRAIIDYRSFNISRGEKVQFIQPGRNSTVLNRVTEANPSRIFGTMEANGRIVLMNPYGIFFGSGAVINVGSLIAAAGKMSDADFLAGKGNIGLSGSVTNHGNITAVDGVSLYGTKVQNSGTITSQAGAIEMLAGSNVYVGETGGNIFAAAAAPAPKPRVVTRSAAPVTNSGKLSAPKVTLAAGDAFGLAIAHSGDIRSQDVTLQAPKGIVVVSGRVDASNRAPGGTGGKVKFLGDKVTLRNAVVDASGDAGGGEVLVGGDYQGGNGVQTAKQTSVDARSVITADALAVGDGGKVIVWADGRTDFAGTISTRGGALGGDGGLIETSGKLSLSYTGRVDTQAPAGETGTLLLDPTNIYIADNAGSTGIPGINTSADTGTGLNPTTFRATGNNVTNSLLTTGNLVAALANSRVIVSTLNNPGNGVGNIFVVDPINAPATAHGLTLLAEAGIELGADIDFSGSTGSVALSAVGAITTTGGQIRMGGGDLLLKSGTGVGVSGTPIVTAGVTSIAAQAATSGGVFVQNTGASTVTINSVTIADAGAPVSGVLAANGNISIVASGGMAVSAPVSASAIVLNAGTGLDITDSVTADAGTIQLLANQGGAGANSFTMGLGGSVSTTNTTPGAVTINVNTAVGGSGGAALADITARNIVSGNGGGITVTTNASASGGSITYASGGGLNVTGTGGSVTLRVPEAGTSGIGTNLAGIRMTSTGGSLNLTAGSGGAFVRNTGALTLASPTLNANSALDIAATGILTLPSVALSTGTGILSLQSGGTLTTAGSLTSGSGNITLLASGLLNVGHQISSTSGNVLISSTAGVTLSSPLNAGSGSIEIRANSDGAGNEGFSQSESITTTNSTPTAVVITVNDSDSGTGAAALHGISAGAGGGITIDTSAGGNATGGVITRTSGTNLNSGSTGAISLRTGLPGAAIGTSGTPIRFAPGQSSLAGGVTAFTTGGDVFLTSDGSLTVDSVTTSRLGGAAGVVDIRLGAGTGELTVGDINAVGGDATGNTDGFAGGSVTLESRNQLKIAGNIDTSGGDAIANGRDGGDGGAVSLSTLNPAQNILLGDALNPILGIKTSGGSAIEAGNGVGGVGGVITATTVGGGITVTTDLIGGYAFDTSPGAFGNPSSGAISLTGAVTIDGRLSLGGDNAVASMTVNGNLTFTNASKLFVNLEGNGAGEFDRIFVALAGATINLGSATLEGIDDLNVGESVRIIDSAATVTRIGTFSNGASVALSGDFSIAYGSLPGRVTLTRGQTNWIWDGSSNNNWSTKQNWDRNNGYPKGGDVVTFPAGASRFDPFVDVSDVSLKTMIFTGGSYTISGDSDGNGPFSITLSNTDPILLPGDGFVVKVNVADPATQTLDLPIILESDARFGIEQGKLVIGENGTIKSLAGSPTPFSLTVNTGAFPVGANQSFVMGGNIGGAFRSGTSVNLSHEGSTYQVTANPAAPDERLSSITVVVPNIVFGAPSSTPAIGRNRIVSFNTTGSQQFTYSVSGSLASGVEFIGDALAFSGSDLGLSGGGNVDVALFLRGPGQTVTIPTGLPTTIIRNFVVGGKDAGLGNVQFQRPGGMTTTGAQVYYAALNLSGDFGVSAGLAGTNELDLAPDVGIALLAPVNSDSQATPRNLTLNSPGLTWVAGNVGAGANGTTGGVMEADDRPLGSVAFGLGPLHLGGNTGADFSLVTMRHAAAATTGTQTFAGPVTLDANTRLVVFNESGVIGTGDIAFNSTVNGARALTLSTAGVSQFGDGGADNVGGVNALASLTTDGAGATLFNIAGGTSVLTSGAQIYGDAIILLQSTSLRSSAGDIALAPVFGNNNDFILQTGAAAGLDVTGTSVSGVNVLQLQTIGGTATFTGAVNANTFNVLGSVVNLASTGTGGFITNNFVPGNSGTLTLGQAGGTQTYNGGINTAGVGGLVTLNGTINTNDALLAVGAVTLGSATTLSTNAVTAAGDITLGTVTGGNNNLTLRTGVVAGADVSATTINGVNTLQLENIGGTASFTGGVTATTFSVPGSVVNVSSTGTGGAIATNFVPANSGTLTLGQSGGTQTYNGGINTTGVGLVTLNGTIATSDDLITLDAVTLGSATTLNTNATTAAGDIILGAVTGGNNNLTLRTGAVAGADVLGTSVTGVNTLQLQTIGGTASFTGAVIANTFNVSATVVNVSSTGIGGVIANNFVPVNTGTLTLGQAGGFQTYDGGIDTTGVGSTVTLNGIIFASDDSMEFGPVTLGSATILDSNAISSSGDITLGAVTGGNNNLTLETGPVAGADVDATSVGGVNILQLQNIGGTASFTGAVNTTTFSILGSVVNVSSTGSGGVITTSFVPTNTGTLTLGQAGGTQTYNGGLNTIFVGGLVTLNGTIATSDDVIALGAVTIGSATTLNTNAVTAGGDIILGAVTGGGNDLTLQTGSVAGADVFGTSVAGVDTFQLQSIGGTASFTGAVSADTFNVPATVVNVISTGTGGVIANNFVPVNTGILTLGQAGGTQNYNGGIDTTGVGSTVTLNGLIAASDDPMIFGPVTLGSATILDSNATSSSGDITLGAVTGGGNNLTLETGPVANADVNATSISGVNILQLQNIGGTASFTGAVIATTFNIPSSVVNVSSTGTGGFITTFFAPQNSGDLTLGQPGGTQTYAAGFDTTGVGGTVTLNGGFETINAPITLGDISLSSDLSLNTNAIDALATITIGNVTGNNFSLRLQTGAGVPANVTVASVDGVNILQLLNIGGTALFSGPVSATAFNVPATVNNVASLGDGGVVQNQFVPQNSGILVLGQDGGTQAYTGGVNATGVAGGVTLNGIFTTASQALTFGQILLGSDVALITNGINAAGSITIGNVAGAGHALNLNAGPLANIAGVDVNNVSTLTISNSANTTFTGTIGATIPGDVDLVATTGTIAFQGNTHIVELTTAAGGYSVAFIGTDNRIEQPVTFANTGVLILGDSSGDRITFDQGVIATAPEVETAGLIVIGGNSSGTFGSSTKSITIAADTTFQALGSGALDFEGTVDSGTGGPFDLKIEKTSAVTPIDPKINKVTFEQPVGEISPLASLVITAGDGIVFEEAAKQVKTTGLQTYNSPVKVSLSGTPAPRTMKFNSQSGDIVFNSTLTSNKPTTIGAQNLTFANNVTATSLDVTVPGVTTLGGSVPTMKVTTLKGPQAYSGSVNVLSNVTIDSTTLTIGSLAVNGGKKFTANSSAITLSNGISKNSGFIILNPTASFLSKGPVNSDGSLTINGNGKTIAFEKIVEGSGILTVDAGDQGAVSFAEKVSQGVITVDGRVISIASADAKLGSLTLRAQTLLELTGESFKASGDVLFNNFTGQSLFALAQPGDGDATILRRTGDVVIESSGNFTMGPGEKFLVNAGSLRITAKKTATVGDLAAFVTLFVKASTIAMQGREPSGSTIDGRKDEGLGFVGRVINFNNSKLEFVGLGPQEATFATETGFPLNVNRSLSNAGIAFETMDGFEKQFGKAGSKSFGQFEALSLLQPIANGVRASEATETQTPIVEQRPVPIVLEQNSSFTAAVKEALNRMRVRPRDATVEESESMSLLRGLLKQPIEGRAELDDDDYKVVVNRLVNEEVEHVLEEYLTLTSSYFEDWTKKMGTPRPKPAAFLELAASGRIKGAESLDKVYDKPTKLKQAVEELVLAYQAGDPSKDLGGFLEWLQAQRGDAKLGKQAVFLAQNLDVLARVVVRLGQIGLTGKELDLSKQSLMRSIVGKYLELVPILFAEAPKPGAIPKVVAQAPQPEAPLTIEGPTSIDPLLPGGIPAPDQPSIQPPPGTDVPPAPPTDVPPAPPGTVAPPAPGPDAPAPTPGAATPPAPPTPDAATPSAPPAPEAAPAPEVPAAPGN